MLKHKNQSETPLTSHLHFSAGENQRVIIAVHLPAVRVEEAWTGLMVLWVFVHLHVCIC